ncbi:hypothetical protein ACFYKX_02955 [Cytobacillus sp. FJAT-54145]|uniref:DUF2651 domain-containing protein n=1 Tax=Cytobacillus spartinae TaxID=3299023 RepID=A0ABW6K9U4_9BACI
MKFLLYGIPVLFLLVASFFILDKSKKNKFIVYPFIITLVFIIVHMLFISYMGSWVFLGFIFLTSASLFFTFILFLFVRRRR